MPYLRSALSILIPALLGACSDNRSDGGSQESAGSRATTVDSVRLIATVQGFSGPEAVRYDPDQDVYFVSNWGRGQPDAKDDNGFISRMSADGVIDSLRFIAGGARGATLHSPRGMAIVGDTLWVVDVDAIRGFDRRTGAPVATVDFSRRELGFLNDVAVGPDGLYVTDTGTDHIYRIAGRGVTVALRDSTLGGPNGIAWDSAGVRFIVVPFGGESVIRSWKADSGTLAVLGRSGGAQFDGVEVTPRGMLVASQADSSIHLFTGGTGGPIIRTGGEPADIGFDTRRGRVAAPFVGRGVVEIWEVPNATATGVGSR